MFDFCLVLWQKVATVSLAEGTHVDQAISGAVEAEEAMAALPTFERRKILSFIASQIEANKDAFASVLCIEAGKPIK